MYESFVIKQLGILTFVELRGRGAACCVVTTARHARDRGLGW